MRSPSSSHNFVLWKKKSSCWSYTLPPWNPRYDFWKLSVPTLNLRSTWSRYSPPELSATTTMCQYFTSSLDVEVCQRTLLFVNTTSCMISVIIMCTNNYSGSGYIRFGPGKYKICICNLSTHDLHSLNISNKGNCTATIFLTAFAETIVFCDIQSLLSLHVISSFFVNTTHDCSNNINLELLILWSLS